MVQILRCRDRLSGTVEETVSNFFVVSASAFPTGKQANGVHSQSDFSSNGLEEPASLLPRLLLLGRGQLSTLLLGESDDVMWSEVRSVMLSVR